MLSITPLRNILEAINLEEPSRIPLTALEQEHAVKIAGVSYADYARDPKVIAMVQKLAVKKYSLDMAWVHVDDWIEYEAMGDRLRFSYENVPVCEEYVVKGEEDLDKLEIPDPNRDGRIPVLLEGINLLSREIGDQIMICGRVASAFSGMLLLRGLEQGLKDLYLNKGLVEKLLKIAHEVAKVSAEAQVRAGAHALWIGDCLASSRIISPRFQEDYSLPYLKRIVEYVKSIGGISIIFTDERDLTRFEKEAEVNPDVHAVGTGLSIREVKERLGDKECLFGNVDPINPLLQGSTTEVSEAVRDCISGGAPGGGFILSTGECVCRETPEENLYAYVKAAKSNSEYPKKEFP
ncbi:MAG: uroporphyrinogen decarboxylase family protein [Candidatus Bathyarchaeia archaeon]